MSLRFRGPRADGGPGDEFPQVLRHDRIQRLGRRREAHLRQLDQESPRHPDALLDVERVVHVRIVDQALPADGRARLLEVDPHDQVEGRRNPLRQRPQSPCVLARRIQVVDRTGADHHEQSRVAAIEDVADHGPRIQDASLGLGRSGQLALDLLRSRQQLARGDVDVIELLGHRRDTAAWRARQYNRRDSSARATARCARSWTQAAAAPPRAGRLRRALSLSPRVGRAASPATARGPEPANPAPAARPGARTVANGSGAPCAQARAGTGSGPRPPAGT